MSSRPWKFAAGLALILAGCGGESPAPAVKTVETDNAAVVAPAPTNSGEVAAKPSAEPALPASAPVVKAEPLGEPIDPLAQARTMFQNGKADEAIAKVEAYLKDKPEDRNALFLVTMMTQAKGANLATNGKRKAGSTEFYKSAEYARRLASAAKDATAEEKQVMSMALYNEACSLAIEDKPEPAIQSLKDAMALGFEDKTTFAEDAELDSLRKRPDFIEIAEKLGVENTQAKAKRLLAENQPFPFSFKLTDFEGKPVSAEELKGKVAIIDFWGTWCPPCRKELPVLASLYEKYKAQGFDIVGINCNEGSGPEVVENIKKFLANTKVPYRCALSDEKVENQIPNLEAFPTTLFLDRSGTVRLKLVGFDPAEKDLLEEVVKLLVDEKP